MRKRRLDDGDGGLRLVGYRRAEQLTVGSTGGRDNQSLLGPSDEVISKQVLAPESSRLQARLP